MFKVKGFRIGKITLILCVCLYRLLLDWCYFNVLVERYAYERYYDYSSGGLLMISWICLAISLGAVVKLVLDIQERPSTIIILGLYLISYVPFTSCIYAGILSEGFIVCNVIYWLILLYAQRFFLGRKIKPMPRFAYDSWKVDDKVVQLLGVLSLIFVIYLSAKYTKFRLNFNLFSVYELRAQAKMSFSALEKYAFAWTRAINSVLLAHCLVKKKYLWAVVYFMTQMLSFGIDGLKSTFFMPFLVVTAVIVYQWVTAVQAKKVLVLGITAISLVAVLEFLFTKSHYIILFIIRRLHFATNLLHEFYYDFFTQNEPDYFRGSFLRHFGFESPYESIDLLIGREYLNKVEACNNGLVSDALANFGVIGIFIMPIALVCCLWLFDKAACGLDKRVTIASSLYLAYIILSSFLGTVLLTHGMLVLILLVSMMERKQAKSYDG